MWGCEGRAGLQLCKGRPTLVGGTRLYPSIAGHGGSMHLQGSTPAMHHPAALHPAPPPAAREAQEAMEAAVRRGEPVPDPETRFDSNCITPGTRAGFSCPCAVSRMACMRRLPLALLFACSRPLRRLDTWQSRCPADAVTVRGADAMRRSPLLLTRLPLRPLLRLQPSWRGWAPTSASSSARRLRRTRPGRSQPSSSAVGPVLVVAGLMCAALEGAARGSAAHRAGLVGYRCWPPALLPLPLPGGQAGVYCSLHLLTSLPN